MSTRSNNSTAASTENDTRRGVGSGGRGRLHPDQEDAIERISDTLSSVLGREVTVAPAGRGKGYRVELLVDSAEDAVHLARRLTVRSVA